MTKTKYTLPSFDDIHKKVLDEIWQRDPKCEEIGSYNVTVLRIMYKIIKKELESSAKHQPTAEVMKCSQAVN